ncbi:hypothetical protein SEPCBS119000_002370 [Sporothrix epigloea]|uniref:FAD/NAD(P)-binding domain-containing protein n=1 Tax=Sporothrix epigloea TaxID=1892477 RepID=A0ABP0DJA1_9PEZI
MLPISRLPTAMLESITSYPIRYLLPGLLVVATPLLVRFIQVFNKNRPSLIGNMSVAASDHTVVVLGAGYAGVPMAHHLLKHTPAGVVNVRVILVAPNDALFWNAASPRGFLPVDNAKSSANPKGTPGFGDDRLFYDLAPGFAKYNEHDAKRFKQLLGRATSLDPDRQTVDVALLAGGEVETVHYDTILIATGSDMADGMPFKIVPHGGTAETKAALAAYRAQVETASHIVVAGGGMTGVEVAGELGSVYGSKVVGGPAPGAPSSQKKDIVLVINEPLPLGAYSAKDGVRTTAANRLTALGVRIINNSKVAASAVDGAKTTLTLVGRDGKQSTLETDVFIPAVGAVVNTQFLPERLLDTSSQGKRRVRTRASLQAEGYDNIFVIGDAANLEAPSIKNVTQQLEVLAPNMQAHLSNWAAACRSGAKQTAGSVATPPASAPLKEYNVSDTIVFAVSTGPAGGTGQMGSWKLLSCLIWLFKARFMGTDKAQAYANGERTFANSKW